MLENLNLQPETCNLKPRTMLTKPILRQQMIAKRAALPASQRLAAAAAVANHFADHPYLTYAASFAGYYAMKAELDVLPIFNRMSTFNKITALPIVVDAQSPLTFGIWAPGTALAEGAHGTKQPAPETPTIIPEVVLVPLLAFDAQGYRLGYGGGYYDRTIAHLRATAPKPPLCVGVGFCAQEISEIPREEHDERLDGILTEEGASFF